MSVPDERRGLDYDPWAHARWLGIPVERQLMRAEGGRHRWGVYLHDERRILLHPALTDVEARCTLAHELAHAMHGHRPAPAGVHAEQEAQANRDAYARLVDPDELAAATVEHDGRPGAIASALRVIPELLTWHGRCEDPAPAAAVPGYSVPRSTPSRRS